METAVKTDQEKLAEVDDLFNFILKMQDKLSMGIVTEEEARLGEGRKGVLMIRGDNKWSRVFEVCGGRLIKRDNLDGVRTFIVFEGIDPFREVCKGLLNGETSAISRAKARGQVKVEGDYAIRDLMIFNRLLGSIARTLNNYGVKL